ncbi:hypothetical protein PVAP13_6NG303600 [Panicum virgatum]|uniref:L-ascorbate peroxidase n=1 Tax=Panicum virgatum TaxID=38727 RepID=A0A8T0R2U4_PANVG|nr:hypothetical protein PVAP13_6NG303600 [Panicum virgatum]
MELTNIPYLASSSSSSIFYSSYSRCTCRGKKAGNLVITASAAGGRCAADLACSQLVERENKDALSGPRSSWHYRRREFASAILLPFLLPHVDVSSAAETYNESIIRSGVRTVLTKAKAAGVLRLVFHDAGTFDVSDKSGGMNGSIIYEVDRPENTGLNRSIKILGKAKSGIDDIQKVSWADLIAVAGAEAVALCGGPEIPVRLGRLDSRPQEMVVLSGAHTIGGKGFGSPIVFDNTYFKVLLEKKPQTSSSGMEAMVGLRTDWALTEDDECLRWIRIYAEDQARFFDDFRDTYIKLVDSGATWRTA